MSYLICKICFLFLRKNSKKNYIKSIKANIMLLIVITFFKWETLVNLVWHSSLKPNNIFLKTKSSFHKRKRQHKCTIQIGWNRNINFDLQICHRLHHIQNQNKIEDELINSNLDLIKKHTYLPIPYGNFKRSSVRMMACFTSS